MVKKIFIVLAIFVVIILFFIFNSNSPKTKPSFEIVLWAWERPENLLFLENQNVGVAFLAGSIVFENSKTKVLPRFQPLTLVEKTLLVSVVRIDNLNREQEQLTKDQLITAANFIVEMCLQNEKISACQIDFDARTSERDFYKQLILKVKNQLPKSMPLSITSLVSWCDINSWLEDLLIEEAVPMFYRLGDDESSIRKDLAGSSFMKSQVCQKSIGVSTDEPLPHAKYLKNRRIYVFNPRSWTENDFKHIIRIIKEKLSVSVD